MIMQLMHVKCIHELFRFFAILLTCIFIYYDVISMNLDDLGDFPRSPPYFGYNSTGPEIPVFVIFRFRDLYGLKLTGDFLRINIFQNMTMRDFGTKQKESGG